MLIQIKNKNAIQPEITVTVGIDYVLASKTNSITF